MKTLNLFLLRNAYITALLSFLTMHNPTVNAQGTGSDNLLYLNPNTVKMTINGNGYSDQTYVIVVPGSTFGFDSQYDAYKLMGIFEAPQLYSIISCCNLSVNAIPQLYTNMTVQLGFKVGATTNYTITTEGLYTFGADTSVTLHDTKENVILNLKTDSVYTFVGEPSDASTRFKLHFNYPVRLSLKLFLEGPYMGSNMATALNNNDELPLNQPFNVSPWNYSGTESVTSIPNSDIVDWVLIETRDTTTAALADETTRVERQAAFLLSDGSIVGLDGSTLPEFTGVIKNDLFVIVHHRNHLPVLSANPVVASGGIHSYDFTTSDAQAYGGSSALKNLGGGNYGLISGDGNADGSINTNDKISLWDLIVGKKGYESADYNLDGQVNNIDKNDLWFENTGESSQLP